MVRKSRRRYIGWVQPWWIAGPANRRLSRLCDRLVGGPQVRSHLPPAAGLSLPITGLCAKTPPVLRRLVRAYPPPRPGPGIEKALSLGEVLSSLPTSEPQKIRDMAPYATR